jgi:phytoene dehydrogenase-like protein
VSNADPKRTFFGLVEPTELDPEFIRKVKRVRTRGAFAKVHLALAELPRFEGTAGRPELLEGVVRISPSLDYLERAYDDAKYGGVSRSPYLEVVIPSLTDPTLAPPGQHAMSVYVQYAPYELKEGSWDAHRREALGDRVVGTLSEYAPGMCTGSPEGVHPTGRWRSTSSSSCGPYPNAPNTGRRFAISTCAARAPIRAVGSAARPGTTPRGRYFGPGSAPSRPGSTLGRLERPLTSFQRPGQAGGAAESLEADLLPP